MLFYARKVMRPAIALVLFLSGFAVLLVVEREAASARAAAPVTLSSGLSASRATIPVSFNGRQASCILDTGSSAILVSPTLARDAGLAGERGTFEVAPDGRTYADRETEISRFAVSRFAVRDVHALISSNLTGYNALCGYDFFTRFPSLIDRVRGTVTLFPAPSKIARMHCLLVDLAPRVPISDDRDQRHVAESDRARFGNVGRWSAMGRRARTLAQPVGFRGKLHRSAPNGNRFLLRSLGIRAIRNGDGYKLHADVHRSRAPRRLQRDHRDQPSRHACDGGRLPSSANLLRRRKLFASVVPFQQPPLTVGLRHPELSQRHRELLPVSW